MDDASVLYGVVASRRQEQTEVTTRAKTKLKIKWALVSLVQLLSQGEAN